ncbi:MAG TPA: hypothetical protein VIU62_22220 [Chloroflexota bacterium]
MRNIAAQQGLSPAALQRHKNDHIPPPLAAEHQEQQQAYALDVLAQLKAINAASLGVLKDARQSGDGELVLKAVDRVQRQIELQAKLLGELDERPQVNVLVMPEWVTLRARLLVALAPYPAARLALAEALDAG